MMMNERPPRLPQYMSEYGLRRDRERVLLEIEMAQRVIELAFDRLEVIDRMLEGIDK